MDQERPIRPIGPVGVAIWPLANGRLAINTAFADSREHNGTYQYSLVSAEQRTERIMAQVMRNLPTRISYLKVVGAYSDELYARCQDDGRLHGGPPAHRTAAVRLARAAYQNLPSGRLRGSSIQCYATPVEGEPYQVAVEAIPGPHGPAWAFVTGRGWYDSGRPLISHSIELTAWYGVCWALDHYGNNAPVTVIVSKTLVGEAYNKLLDRQPLSPQPLWLPKSAHQESSRYITQFATPPRIKLARRDKNPLSAIAAQIAHERAYRPPE